MHASEVIETYVDDTVRLLPRRQRADVATELRSLLNDELQARAQASGRPPDGALAMSLVRDYGHPNEVAARYGQPWTIIDPADSTNFLRAALIGAIALVLLSILNKRVMTPPIEAAALVKTGILSWLGVLVVAFGLKQWFRRQWPAKVAWEPRDGDRVSRVWTALLIPFAAICVALYAAPAWVLRLITGGRLETSWAAYTPEFQRVGLPCFIGLLIALIALRAAVAIHGRWRRITRRINIGLNLALACVVLGLAVSGNVFQSSAVDPIARDVLALIAVIYIPSVGVMIYREMGRGERGGAAEVAKSTVAGMVV